MKRKNKFRKLRDQAESVIRDADNQPEVLVSQDIDALRHELMVHHTELELQLEELTLTNQHLEESRQRYFSLFNDAPVAYVTTDHEGTLLDVNQRFLEMVNQPRWRVIGKSLAEYLAPLDRDVYHIHRRNVLRDGVQQCEVAINLPSTPVIDVKIRTDRFNQSEKTLFTVLTDISAIKQTQQALQAALAQEQQMNNLRVHVLSVINHEFRTPLSSIIISVEMLMRYADRLTEEQKQVRYEAMYGRLWYLNDIVQQVIMAHGLFIDERRVQPHTFGLTEFLGRAVNEVAAQRHELHRVHFRADDDDEIMVTFDERLIYQIIVCLVDNAIAYSTDEVLVTSGVSDETVTIRVQDHGPGIPLDEQPLICEAFYRGSSAKDKPGTGMGLYVASLAVKAHGGLLRVESEPGQGSTFIVELPRLGLTAHQRP